MKLFFLLLICFHPVYASKHPVIIGHTKVIIQKVQNGKGKAFIHLHQNETTALMTAMTYMRLQGGTVITLLHSGQRNIVFHDEGKRFEFDPNRIFSERGIRQTLTMFGAYTPHAHQKVNLLAKAIIAAIPPGKIIAVHNNQESYSLHEYLKGHTMASDARKLHVNHEKHHRNFYVVTQEKVFDRLKALAFNGVLQDEYPSDDGSLSVYFAKQNYVNVEAGYDQWLAQLSMLYFA